MIYTVKNTQTGETKTLTKNAFERFFDNRNYLDYVIIKKNMDEVNQ